MNQVSITSTETFAARAQRSEQRRVWVWMITLVATAVLIVTRRMLGGEVMSVNRTFYPMIAVLASAVVVQGTLLSILRRANRHSVLLPDFLWRASAIFDFCVPAAMLLILAFESPRGAVVALSAPSLLFFPMVILLSVLRLKPNFTLLTGLAAAIFHAFLSVRALSLEGADQTEYPVYFSYAVSLALIAVAGMLVSREMRTHVREASDEAAAHEKAQHSIALVNRDLAVARDIQRGLLPSGPPNFEGFDIAGMNTPADQTGGDYYDFQELPGGRLVTVLADVTGHGIGPAIVMAVCRAYARASARVIDDPIVLMARLNELLHHDLPADRFITFAIAILNSSGRVDLLSAGHGPSLLYQVSTKKIVQFGGNGLPLGVFPDETYGPTATFDMQRGDLLVMLTDGFFEWQRPSDREPFGIERLHELLASCVEKSATEIVKIFDDTVRNFASGSPQSDDMTMVVIKRA